MKIKKIAQDFDIKVVNITKNNIEKYSKKYSIDKNDLKNNAYIIGDDEIILGIFQNPEIKTATFFHEIGHTLVTKHFARLINYDVMLIEYQAWIEGLRVAKKYNYTFSNNVFKYILESLNSYYREALNNYGKRKRNVKKIIDQNPI